MLKINNNEYKILSSEIKYAQATYNNKKGYSILVSLDIELNNIKGYISFYVDFFETNDIKNIENKKYIKLSSIIKFILIWLLIILPNSKFISLSIKSIKVLVILLTIKLKWI